MKMIKAVTSFRTKWAAMLVALTGLFVSGIASAQTDDFSTALVTELSGGKAQILAVGGAIMVLVAIVLLFRYIKRSAN